MPHSIEREIHISKPIASPARELILNIFRTDQHLTQRLQEVLRPADLRLDEYNVLRILRGAGEAGLTAGDVGDRMITRDPDVTRLLDRLETRGLAERSRCTEDRRVVWTRITAAGLAAIAPLDEPVNEIHLRHLGHLGPERLATLIGLLEAARGANPAG
jgi:DNA-binding MarR family transcriptional regulator